MKTCFLAIFMMASPFLIQSQIIENHPILKNISIVRKNFRNLKSGEIVNKTILFKEGKLTTIQTSDVIQNFFYNQKGLLDKSTKEKVGSNWKEVINYSFDKEDRLVKFTKKYEEGGEFVTKTVDLSYQGARINAVTRKSNNHENFVDDVEYVVENGLIVRRISRDRIQQIIGKTEYVYANNNIVRHRGLVGEKTIKSYTFDDKNSVNLLIVESLFGKNYKVIVPLVSFYEEEFDFQSISKNNELTFTANSENYDNKIGKYKYNNLNYPVSCALSEANGTVKTEVNYYYE